MADEAEYLRVSTTSLLIDAIESGFIRQVPTVRGVISTLHCVTGDESMRAPVGYWKERSLTAIETQKWYLEACRRYVQQHDNAPDEAYEALQRWSDTLDALQDAPGTLVGKIDWVTKRMLLKKAGDGLPLDANRKIDIKYHELSDSGYFAMLCETDEVETLISDEAVEFAMRSPPSTPRAQRRANLIREFTGDGVPIRATWNSVRVGPFLRGRKIRL